MSWLNSYVLLAALLGLVGTGAGGYWWGYRQAENAAAADKLAAVSRAIEQANAIQEQDERIAANYESSREKVRVVYRTIKEKVNENIDANPAYNQCGLDADGLRLWRAANAGDPEAASGGADGGLPGTPAAAGWETANPDPESRGSGGLVSRMQSQTSGAGGLGEPK